MSERQGFMQILSSPLTRLVSLFTGGAAKAEVAAAQGLPVNLGGYEFARQSPGHAARLQGVDQALVWGAMARGRISRHWPSPCHVLRVRSC